ncbi:Uncharacterized protein K02A2.6 [Araneus ventricosus]|uniref:Uncharacterized protein K02A2.6 n=1 Tax=Araneus ventricosus TaxID=182803 RepID=A0A4Y2A2U7_ARAVE|nr:Uncharacterized protein K02A2.6 [Araneus ventricosus]
MMDAFRPPAPLKFSIGNVKEKWRKWRQELENYLLATEKDECADKIKIAILLNLLGSEGLEIFNTFKFEPPESQKNYSEVLKKFEEYCSPRQNVVYERYKFFSCVQQEGQAIECYVTQLRTLASTCEFEEQENGLIRDRIVLGIRDNGLKERLLRESGLGLEKAIEIVRAAETSREQLRSMKEETAATVNSVKRNRRQNQPKQLSKSTSAKSVNSKNIHEMKVPENELDIYIDSVTEKVQENELNSDSMNKNVEIVSETWYKSVTLNSNDTYFEVDFKLDTGAEVNILPLYVLNIVKVKPKLSETNLSLTAYGNFKLKPEGTIIINCSTSKLKNIPLQFYVVNVKSKPILGLKGCLELKLIERIDAIECSKISKNELIKQYKDVFTGTGEFPDEPYHITLKDNAIPVIHPPRRVLQALQPKLKETLDKLEKEKIGSKVNKPTDWVQRLVIVEKPNGNLRLCLDPRDLNKVIKREHYQIPSADDIISRLEGKKIFSVVDLKDGFWHVPLDEVSSEICTFNTPFGRCKFNKMPFGIASAPEIFQKRNQKLFGDIEGVEIYFDDIIVAGNDEASHDAIMSKVLERARSVNLKLNPDKLQYRVSEVKFGVPNTVISDNIPFNSYIYKKFANDWDFNYAFISPDYSPSNGMVERAVGIAKGIMRKAKEDRKDYFVGLMEYRNIPISGLNLSPAQIMFNRRLKTKLPISNKLLNAELFNNIREKLIMKQNIQKFYYDKTAHPLSEFNQKENVRILNFKNKTWEPAEIVSKHKLHPRSYLVKDQFGKILRHNRKHIRKLNTPFNIETNPNDEIINTSQSDSEVTLNS